MERKDRFVIKNYTLSGRYLEGCPDETDVPYRIMDFGGPTKDAAFAVHSGKIAQDKKKRQAVWEMGQGGYFFFVCPWCRAVSKAENYYIGLRQVSIYCSGKCKRHLFIDFKRSPLRKKKKEAP